MSRQKKQKMIAIMEMCLILLTLCFPMQSHADETVPENVSESVRVAYFDLGDYYKIDKDGNLESYDKAYLDMVSEYTGINFEYVDCRTWVNALDMLEKHEIDLVGTMQWNMEREEKYSVCSTSYGYTVAELAALDDSEYIYEDYEQMNGTIIGCMENYVIYDFVLDLLAEHNISAKIQTFETQKELDAALEKGEIDFVAANAHAMHTDWKIVEKFAYAPFYFASWKGNDALTREISEAIIKINVYLDGCTKPVSWIDDETEEMNGILVDICKQLSYKTGLALEISPKADEQEKTDFSVGYYLFTSNFNASYNGDNGRTESVLEEEFFMYHKSGAKFNSSINMSYRVAVLEGKDDLIEYFATKYKNYEIVTFATAQECLNAVQKEEVDLAFLCGYTADNILITEDINDIVSIPTTSTTFQIGLVFYGEDKEILSDIINKGYKLISTEMVNDIKLKHISTIMPKINLRYLVKNHPVETVIVIGTFFLLLSAMVSLVFYAKIIKKKNLRILEADHARMEFFSRMSHDMRTPMNGILGMARLSKGEKNIEVMQHNMDMVEESGSYMLSLINDTLDLQRIETGKMLLQPEIVRSKTFLEGVFDMVRATALQKKIEFRTTLTNIGYNNDNFLKIDPVRLKQILSNLLSNAIKFTPENGCVEFQAEKLGQVGNIEYIKFRISDTGIGISKEFMKNGLFTAYSQEHNMMAKKYAGSGLGLAITKNLVELMGGRIEVESELGEGTVFTVYLNIEIVDKEVVEQSLYQEKTIVKMAENKLLGKRILLCEDHPLNAEIAKKLLKKTGCEVVWRENGEEGVEAFMQSESGYFDAILMDIRMPKMDGLEATKAIRKLDRADATSIPVIAMTANAYEDDMKKSMEAGMNAHLAKPIEPTKLYETLAYYIE